MNEIPPELDSNLYLFEDHENLNNPDLQVDKVGGAFLGALFNLNAFSQCLHLENYFCAYAATGFTALGTRYMGSYVITLIGKVTDKERADRLAELYKMMTIASAVGFTIGSSLSPNPNNKDSLSRISMDLIKLVGTGLICEEIIKGVSERGAQISEALEATAELWDIHDLKEE